jgi:hypothetical protein
MPWVLSIGLHAALSLSMVTSSRELKNCLCGYNKQANINYSLLFSWGMYIKQQMNTSVGGAINNIECTHGRHRHHARGTGYYPADDPIEGGFVDMRDHKLQTLQVSDVHKFTCRFVTQNVKYVTLCLHQLILCFVIGLLRWTGPSR